MAIPYKVKMAQMCRHAANLGVGMGGRLLPEPVSRSWASHGNAVSCQIRRGAAQLLQLCPHLHQLRPGHGGRSATGQERLHGEIRAAQDQAGFQVHCAVPGCCAAWLLRERLSYLGCQPASGGRHRGRMLSAGRARARGHITSTRWHGFLPKCVHLGRINSLAWKHPAADCISH